MVWQWVWTGRSWKAPTAPIHKVPTPISIQYHIKTHFAGDSSRGESSKRPWAADKNLLRFFFCPANISYNGPCMSWCLVLPLPTPKLRHAGTYRIDHQEVGLQNKNGDFPISFDTTASRNLGGLLNEELPQFPYHR